MRTGRADLPLHGGHVPRWLADRMTSLGALKRGLRPIEDEIGIYVCGGRGRHSRKTPEELASVGERTGLDGAKLADESRLVAKVDGACVQDGFELYLHGFFVTREGSWTVVQQGMSDAKRMARRYHWLSEDLESFVDDPHSAIEGENVGERAKKARAAQIELIKEGPDRVLAEVVKLRPATQQTVLPSTKRRCAITSPRRASCFGGCTQRSRRRTSEDRSTSFDVLATPGLGARTLLSLAMVAEVVHGAPSRFSDPARFSLAHGGKDGHPYPVPIKVYDETIRVMKKAIEAAKLGNSDRASALTARRSSKAPPSMNSSRTRERVRIATVVARFSE